MPIVDAIEEELQAPSAEALDAFLSRAEEWPRLQPSPGAEKLRRLLQAPMTPGGQRAGARAALHRQRGASPTSATCATTSSAPRSWSRQPARGADLGVRKSAACWSSSARG
ncbi:hypothetical protein ACRAWD_02285 [Caulobacter segnis]